MRTRISIVLVIFCLPLLINAQSVNKAYLLKETTKGMISCFQAVELTIHYDNTFTSIAYGCGDKKAWKNYKKWKAEIHNGKISRNGDYYILTEYLHGKKTDVFWTAKITNNSVNFYLPNKKNKLKRSARYKRIELESRY